MRTGELECFHGQGHSAGVHGCDGCCTKLFNYLLDSIKAEAREVERERCTEIMDKLTGHYAQTHYVGKVCKTCDIFAAIYEGS